MSEAYHVMEQDLVNTCLQNNDLIPTVRASLHPRVFLDHGLRHLYVTMLRMADEGQPIDHLTLELESLRDPEFVQYFNDKQDVADTISDLNGKAANESMWEVYAEKVNRNFEQKYSALCAKKASEKIANGDSVQDVLHDMESRINTVSQSLKKPFKPFTEAIKQEMRNMGKRSDPDYDQTTFYVPFPFKSITQIVPGYRYGTLSLLGARPSHGKTTFALNCIRHSVKNEVKTLFISIEMSEAEIAQKILSLECRIPTKHIIEANRLNDLEQESIGNLIETKKKLFAQSFSIDDNSETPSEVMRSIQTGINEGFRFIVIDHLHELSFEERKANISLPEAMGGFVKRLRNISKRNNVAILALCQLNRDVEKRSNKHPVMSDLGDTGALERCAYNIMFLYRDEVGNPASQRPNECDVVIAKSRDSRIGVVPLDFNGAINEFADQF